MVSLREKRKGEKRNGGEILKRLARGAEEATSTRNCILFLCFLICSYSVYTVKRYFSDDYDLEFAKCMNKYETNREFLRTDACTGEWSSEFEREGLAKCHSARVSMMLSPEQCAHKNWSEKMIPARFVKHLTELLTSNMYGYALFPLFGVLALGYSMYLNVDMKKHDRRLKSKERGNRRQFRQMKRIHRLTNSMHRSMSTPNLHVRQRPLLIQAVQTRDQSCVLGGSSATSESDLAGESPFSIENID